MVSLHRKVATYYLLPFLFTFSFTLCICICSGGKDLSGNKRTNKSHSFDQKFEKYNRALQVSCLQGYPVRVVRLPHHPFFSAYFILAQVQLKKLKLCATYYFLLIEA